MMKQTPESFSCSRDLKNGRACAIIVESVDLGSAASETVKVALFGPTLNPSFRGRK